MTIALSAPTSIESWLGDEAESLLTYKAKVPKEMLHLPGADFVDRIFAQSDRHPQVLRNLQQLYSTGRLANTGYLSILPVDQGIEHSAAASFAPNPHYFDLVVCYWLLVICYLLFAFLPCLPILRPHPSALRPHPSSLILSFTLSSPCTI